MISEITHNEHNAAMHIENRLLLRNLPETNGHADGVFGPNECDRVQWFSQVVVREKY